MNLKITQNSVRGVLMHNTRLKLQLPLDEFVSTEYEDKIIQRIHEVNKILDRPVMLRLWYDKSKKVVSESTIKRFINQWDDKLPYKTEITIGMSKSPRDFIFFNITHKSNFNYSSWTRYDYVYDNYHPQNILHGLDIFKETAEFCFRKLPEKNKSKRND